MLYLIKVITMTISLYSDGFYHHDGSTQGIIEALNYHVSESQCVITQVYGCKSFCHDTSLTLDINDFPKDTIEVCTKILSENKRAYSIDGFHVEYK